MAASCISGGSDVHSVGAVGIPYVLSCFVIVSNSLATGIEIFGLNAAIQNSGCAAKWLLARGARGPSKLEQKHGVRWHRDASRCTAPGPCSAGVAARFAGADSMLRVSRRGWTPATEKRGVHHLVDIAAVDERQRMFRAIKNGKSHD